jgi:hypothetical protein
MPCMLRHWVIVGQGNVQGLNWPHVTQITRLPEGSLGGVGVTAELYLNKVRTWCAGTLVEGLRENEPPQAHAIEL